MNRVTPVVPIAYKICSNLEFSENPDWLRAASYLCEFSINSSDTDSGKTGLIVSSIPINSGPTSFKKLNSGLELSDSLITN